MDNLSLRKIKLFKGSEIFPKRAKKATPPPTEEKVPLKVKIRRSPVLYLFLFVLLLSFLISYFPLKSLSSPNLGEIAGSDIIAPLDLTIEDIETTEKRKKEAADAVLPVYRLDSKVFLNTKTKIGQIFRFGQEWASNPASAGQKAESLQQAISENFGDEIPLRIVSALLRVKFPDDIAETLTNLINKVSARGIVTSKTLFTRGEPEKGLTLMTSETERTVKVGDLLDLKEANGIVADEVEKLEIPARNKTILKDLATVFLAQNVSFLEAQTEARRVRARSSVETVFFAIKKGKVIVRKGDEVNAEALKYIELINRMLQRKASWVPYFAGTALLFVLLFITLWYYLKSNLSGDEAWRQFILVGSTLVLSLIFYKLSSFFAESFSRYSNIAALANSETYDYAFPYQTGTLIFAFLTLSPIALVFNVLNSLMVGYLLGANFYQMVFCFVGGLAAMYGVKYFQRQRRTSVLRSGLFLVGPANIFVIITIHLIREKMVTLNVLGAEILMGLLGGAFSAALSFILLPIVETVFSFVTATKLLELTNSDLPIFRQMAMEAPGSYHHSLIVSTLAEKAAEEIKVDSSLTKAGALYHDIGKVKMPEYFIENRSLESDLHKGLTPSMSTLVIVNHVREGVEIARKLKVPRKIRDIIEQHHGNSLVRYFFQKAKEKYDPDLHKIGEEDYRYPGPQPKSKEAALVLLADSVEAASRSLKSPTRDSLKRMITDIFNSYLQDGQLDDSDLSLKDLRSAAASFLSILYAIYHPRVEYPGFEFEIKKEKKNNSHNGAKQNDRNPQQTT